VKPHGELYNRCSVEADAARAVASAVRSASPELAILALSGSELARQAENAGLRVYAEAFADRGYGEDGTLLPRGASGAVITDPNLAAERALVMAAEGRVSSASGTRLELHVDSI